MTQLFSEIQQVQLDNAFIGNLNNQLNNINGNFKKLLSLPLVKGDKGDNVYVSEARTYVMFHQLTDIHVLTELGKQIVREIYRIYPQEYRDLIENSLTQSGTLERLVSVLETIELAGTSEFEATSISIDSFPGLVKIYHQRTTEQVVEQENITTFDGVSVGYVFHLDNRLHDVPNYENELAVNFIDTSCVLMVDDIQGEYDGLVPPPDDIIITSATVSRHSIIPTLYFDGDGTGSDNHSNTFCWMINDRKTGITAQGIKGDKGDNAVAYICSGCLDGDSITINSVLSPSVDENNNTIDPSDIPVGSIAFVWFEHNDGIPTDEDYDPYDPYNPEATDVIYTASVVEIDHDEYNYNVVPGTLRYRALDLTVGIVHHNIQDQPVIDYNIDYSGSTYLSLANIFQSCVLYNEMLRLNKYPHVARGIFVPDNGVDYNNTYSGSNEPRYHMFGSFSDRDSYIGLAPISEILRTENINDPLPAYTQIYKDYGDFVTGSGNISPNLMGTLRSLYQNFYMHDLKISVLQGSARSVLNTEDDPGSKLLQMKVTLGDWAESPNGTAQISMLVKNDWDNTTGGYTNHYQNSWRTANRSEFNLLHGSFYCESDPFAPDGYGQSFFVRNPYIKYEAQTQGYYDLGKHTTDQWQGFNILGYNLNLVNIPLIDIYAQPCASSPHIWPYYTKEIQPRINITGDAAYSSEDRSNYIHFNQMKCRFDMTGMNENADHERVFEIIRTSDFTTSGFPVVDYNIDNDTRGDNNPDRTSDSNEKYLMDRSRSLTTGPQPNGIFNGALHYKLGFQCTQASVLLRGDVSGYNDDAIIFQVSHGKSVFENNVSIGGDTTIGGDITVGPGAKKIKTTTTTENTETKYNTYIGVNSIPSLNNDEYTEATERIIIGNERQTQEPGSDYSYTGIQGVVECLNPGISENEVTASNITGHCDNLILNINGTRYRIIIKNGMLGIQLIP